LQWSTWFSRWREEKEGGREKLLVGAPPSAVKEHVPHQRDSGGEVHRMPP